MSRRPSPQALLALPGNLDKPNPYQVLGLRDGESDKAVIAAAGQRTVNRLKQVKAEADAEAWRQAAIWVKQARQILADPQHKARLDQKLAAAVASGGQTTLGSQPGSAHHRGPMNQPGVAAGTPSDQSDPLAAVLPSNSVRGNGPDASPPSAPPPRNSVSKPTLRAGTASLPPAAAQPPLPPPAPSPATSPPDAVRPVPPAPGAVLANAGESEPTAVWPAPGPPNPPAELPGQSATPVMPVDFTPAVAAEPPRRRRRRKSFPWATVVLTCFAIGCLASITGLVYILAKNPVVINFGGGGQQATDGTSVAAQASAAQQQGEQDRGQRDPIMGRYSGDRAQQDPPRQAQRQQQAVEADKWLSELSDDGEEPSRGDDAPDDAPQDGTNRGDMRDESAMTDEPMMSDASDTSDTAEPPASDPLTGDVAAGQAALDAARQAIRRADWQTMAQQAQAAVQAAADEDQRRSAEALQSLAHWAAYYHEGVQQGLEKLGAGESFNITDQLQVVIVEIAPEKVIVRFSGKNRDYPRGELPLVMVHKIVRFALPTESPLLPVAAEAYQAVAPVTTPQYRSQSIETLEGMPEEIDDVRPAEIAAAIRDVYPD